MKVIVITGFLIFLLTSLQSMGATARLKVDPFQGNIQNFSQGVVANNSISLKISWYCTKSTILNAMSSAGQGGCGDSSGKQIVQISESGEFSVEEIKEKKRVFGLMSSVWFTLNVEILVNGQEVDSPDLRYEARGDGNIGEDLKRDLKSLVFYHITKKEFPFSATFYTASGETDYESWLAEHEGDSLGVNISAQVDGAPRLRARAFTYFGSTEEKSALRLQGNKLVMDGYTFVLQSDSPSQEVTGQIYLAVEISVRSTDNDGDFLLKRRNTVMVSEAGLKLTGPDENIPNVPIKAHADLDNYEKVINVNSENEKIDPEVLQELPYGVL